MTPSPTADDHAGCLVAEQEREVVVDPALAVVQVGVTDTARLDVDQRLAGAGVGDQDRLDCDRGTLALRHHTANLVHRTPPLP